MNKIELNKICQLARDGKLGAEAVPWLCLEIDQLQEKLAYAVQPRIHFDKDITVHGNLNMGTLIDFDPGKSTIVLQ